MIFLIAEPKALETHVYKVEGYHFSMFRGYNVRIMKQWVMEFNFFGVRCVFFPSCVFISNRELCYSDIYAVVSEDLYEVHWGVPLACVVSKKQWSEGLTLCLRLSDVRLFCLIVCFYIFTSCEDFWFSILKKLHIFTVVHQLNSLLRYS